MIATGPSWELRLGDWRDVLADVSVDAVVTDPPYSARTHAGHDDGARMANRGPWMRASGEPDPGKARRSITYEAWEPSDVQDFVDHWMHFCKGWMVAFSDSTLIPAWRMAYEIHKRISFQPLPCVIKGMTVRLCGDGPSSWAVYLNVARPKALSKWGTLPGAYISKPCERIHVGGKPLDLMRAIIRDYTKPGDLVCDPCAGAATTLLAAVMEGRKAIGAEIDPEAFEKGVARLKRGYTPSLFQEVAP